MTNSTRRRRGASNPTAASGNPAAALEALVNDGASADATTEDAPETLGSTAEGSVEPEVEDTGPNAADPIEPEGGEGPKVVAPDDSKRAVKIKSQPAVAPPEPDKTAGLSQKELLQKAVDEADAKVKKARDTAAATVAHDTSIQTPAEAAKAMGVKPGDRLTLAQANAIRAAGNRNKELELRKIGATAGKIVTDTLLAKEGLRMPGKSRVNKRGEAMKKAMAAKE